MPGLLVGRTGLTRRGRRVGVPSLPMDKSSLGIVITFGVGSRWRWYQGGLGCRTAIQHNNLACLIVLGELLEADHALFRLAAGLFCGILGHHIDVLVVLQEFLDLRPQRLGFDCISAMESQLWRILVYAPLPTLVGVEYYEDSSEG